MTDYYRRQVAQFTHAGSNFTLEVWQEEGVNRWFMGLLRDGEVAAARRIDPDMTVNSAHNFVETKVNPYLKTLEGSNRGSTWEDVANYLADALQQWVFSEDTGQMERAA